MDYKVKIIFKQFNDNNRTTTIELISEKNQLKNINIVVDTLAADEILALFANQYENILQLSENNIHIRINNQNYEIRKITNVSDIIYYLPNSRELLEFYLTDPIANFPCEQLPVKLFELYNNKVLGDKEPEPLEQWWNPKISPELISQQKQTELTNSQLDGSNDSYNIIIELENEEIVNQAVVNLIGKHPTNTVLIQYDLATDQYRVIYGDMDKVAGKKTRWLLVGHGRLDKQSNQRLFANKHAYDIVDKLKKLKETLLVSNEPEKIVLLGCKLGQDNLLDNFALNISQEFWHKGFSATVVAYTKDLYINDSGRKQVYLDGEQHKQSAKYYKNRYIKDSASGEITINGEALILSLLREINLADISLPKAVNRYRDYLNQYFYYPNGELDLDLLKTVAYDGEAYQIFIDNFTSDERISNNYDIGVLIDNLHKKNIYNVPLWSKVNAANITMGSSQILNENGAQIIFRFSGDKIFRQQAELLAQQLPENTFIFQVDKYTNTAIIEYGELNKLNNTEIKKWILLGNIVNYDEQSLFEGLLSAKLVDVLGEIKLFLGLNIPAEVCFFSQQGLGKLANPYDPSGIASETVINLAGRAINSTVTTYQNESNSLLSLSSDELHQYNVLTANPQKLSRFDYNIDTKQLYFNNIPIEQYLLMDIVTNKIDLNKNSHKYSYHLQGYLMDKNDQLDINKINQIKYDPIINRKVNSYFEQNKYIGVNALIEWRNLFLNNQLPTIQQQAYDIKILLENIAYRPQIIHYLSNYSNYLLSQLFFYPNGTINMAKIIMLIQDHTSLENLKISLMELASIDRRSSLSKLTLKQALVKSQQWHNHYLSNIISLANRINKKSIPTFDITINPISHAFYYEKSNRLEKNLSLFYAYNENNTARLSELLQYHHSLLAFSNQRLLTDQEQQFLAALNNVFNSFDFLLAQKKNS
ncbi:MAG: C80 family cysteine peptidase [Arsenophonus sp.]|nr:C80 family cysteine peptidase [Arsenophonus sp.]